MRGACVLGVACLLASATSAWAQGPVIDHAGVGCMAAEKFPQLEARILEPDAISRARVQFRGEAGPWFFVDMKRAGGVFTGILPKPKRSLKTIRYYIEATDREFRVNRTQEFAASVVPQAALCADGKLMAGAATTASVLVGSPASGAALPAGFSSAGVTTATGSSATIAGASAGSGGGIGTAATVGIIAGGAAVAGVAVAVKSGGGGAPETNTPPGAGGPGTSGTGGGGGTAPGAPNPGATSYAGPFAGQRLVTGISQLPGCESTTTTFAGTITLTLQPPSGGAVTGTAETTGGTTVIANTGNCQGQGNKVGDTTEIRWSTGVTGTTGSLVFRVGGTDEWTEFSGALSGGVISGILTFAKSGPFGQSGTLSIPVMLR